MYLLKKTEINLSKNERRMAFIIATASIILIICVVYYFITFQPDFKLTAVIYEDKNIEKIATLSLEEIIFRIDNIKLGDVIILKRDKKNELYIQKVDVSGYRLKRKWWNHRFVMNEYFVSDKNELNLLISLFFKWGNFSTNSGYTIKNISNDISPDF